MGRRRLPLATRRAVLVALLAAVVLVLAPGAVIAVMNAGKQLRGDVATIYQYDTRADRWVKKVTPAPSTPGLPEPAATNTLIIQLQQNNPVQEILFEEALVIGGAEPLFEIDGNAADSGNGTIRIGTLTFFKVDARRLEIADTIVVTSNLTNVVAEDNELNLNITTANVTFVGRGAKSLLSFHNVRFDRVRILGPGGDADGHLERLTVNRTSVFGRIRIEDARIQQLVLTDVSLQD